MIKNYASKTSSFPIIWKEKSSPTRDRLIHCLRKTVSLPWNLLLASVAAFIMRRKFDFGRTAGRTLVGHDKAHSSYSVTAFIMRRKFDFGRTVGKTLVGHDKAHSSYSVTASVGVRRTTSACWSICACQGRFQWVDMIRLEITSYLKLEKET
jgi:hypothetical protein